MSEMILGIDLGTTNSAGGDAIHSFLASHYFQIGTSALTLFIFIVPVAIHCLKDGCAVKWPTAQPGNASIPVSVLKLTRFMIDRNSIMKGVAAASRVVAAYRFANRPFFRIGREVT